MAGGGRCAVWARAGSSGRGLFFYGGIGLGWFVPGVVAILPLISNFP